MGFSKMLELLQEKNKGYIILANAGAFYLARGKDAVKLNEILGLLTTGASEETSKMNIYNLAGNEWEWTLEKTSNVDNPCAYRGGNYNNSSTNLPVSGRGGNNTTYGYSSFIGFRSTFYVK